jgi:hypothetical protein
MNICIKVYIISLILSLAPVYQALSNDNSGPGEHPGDLNESEKLKNFIFRENIKTVKIHPEGWDLGYPVIDIRENIPLIFSFDDFSDESRNYTYTLFHCGSDWVPSDILQSDYLSGFTEAVINDYRFSRNTLRDYIHYTLKIPNEDMQPTLPGNYVLMVYEDYDREKPVITTRFYLVDHIVSIDGRAKRSEDMMHFNTGQEVDFNIRHENLRLDDPDKNIRVVVMQNSNDLTSITDLKPTFVQNDILIYEYEEENHFDGLSEFRYFDTKNLKYITDRIERVEFQRPYQHVYLLPDPVRSIGDYDFYEDINGRFFIKWDEGTDSSIDADYIMTHFSLPFDSPLPGADIYIYGGLTNWALQPEFRMEYNISSGAYELTSPLKQGLYNYFYVFVPENGKVDFTMFEGSHYETENDYLVFVYYQDFRKRYETLVGFKLFNTVEKSMF